jgi:hypothetical protein
MMRTSRHCSSIQGLDRDNKLGISLEKFIREVRWSTSARTRPPKHEAIKIRGLRKD